MPLPAIVPIILGAIGLGSQIVSQGVSGHKASKYQKKQDKRDKKDREKANLLARRAAIARAIGADQPFAAQQILPPKNPPNMAGVNIAQGIGNAMVGAGGMIDRYTPQQGTGTFAQQGGQTYNQSTGPTQAPAYPYKKVPAQIQR